MTVMDSYIQYGTMNHFEYRLSGHEAFYIDKKSLAYVIHKKVNIKIKSIK